MLYFNAVLPNPLVEISFLISDKIFLSSLLLLKFISNSEIKNSLNFLVLNIDQFHN